MKKSIIKTLIITILILGNIGLIYSYAENENTKTEMTEYIRGTNVDTTNITEQDILNAYEEFSQRYSKKEMMNFLETNKEKLNKKGIDDKTIEAGKTILKTTDEEEIKEIIKENVKPQEIKEKLEQGYTANQIVESIINEMPVEQKVNTAGKIILANKIVKLIIIGVIVLFLYTTILRAIIYKKAGKNPIASFIPIYRQITMYNICDLSLGYMALWLVPVMGVIIMFVIAIMKRMYLAKKFGRGVGFGIGLILLPPIFQSILAFNKNIKYVE